VVLGSVAAERRGISSLDGGPLVYLGRQWFPVIGILNDMPLAPDIDRSVLIGYDVAQRLFGIDEAPSTVRVRTDPDDIDSVSELLAATANPEAPNEVDVSRPSDALEARAKADATPHRPAAGPRLWHCWSAASASPT
jgi:putative ABC transport system permease protein